MFWTLLHYCILAEYPERQRSCDLLAATYQMTSIGCSDTWMSAAPALRFTSYLRNSFDRLSCSFFDRPGVAGAVLKKAL